MNESPLHDWRRQAFVVLIALLALSLFPAEWVLAAGPTCTVPGTYSTIQAALNDSGCTTINLAAQTFNERITIARNVTINGAGANSSILDGGGVSRVITVTAGTVSISGIKIQNGNDLSVGGGGINNAGILTLSNSNVTNNYAGIGGGLYNNNTLTLNNTTVISNVAEFGGGVLNVGTMTMNGGNVSDGIALYGGGIMNSDFTGFAPIGVRRPAGVALQSALNNVTVTGNLGVFTGGGILNGGTLNVTGGSVTNNFALLGGGLANGVLIPVATASSTTAMVRGRRLPLPYALSPTQFGAGTATLSNLTISNNQANIPAFVQSFLGIPYPSLGGGILNTEGLVTINNVTLTSNSAVGIPILSAPYNVMIAAGGGIFNADIMTLNNSRLSNNSVTNTGTLTTTISFAQGGGISNSGAISLTNVTLSNNLVSNTLPSQSVIGAASWGGGLGNGAFYLFFPLSANVRKPRQLSSESALLDKVTFSGNRSVLSIAGGISGDSGDASGGGMTNIGISTLAPGQSRKKMPRSPTQGNVTASLFNVTFNGNSVTATGSGAIPYGGALSSFDSTASLVNVTIAGNSINIPPYAGGLDSSSNQVTLLNTLLANNTNGNCDANNISQGHNLSTDGTCNLGAPGDLNNTPQSSSQLRALANNGGPEQTMALYPPNPAIDGGANTGCPSTDERGVSRPKNAVCDIGAYELDPAQFAPEVPEADTLMLLASGIGGLATWLGYQRRKMRRT